MKSVFTALILSAVLIGTAASAAEPLPARLRAACASEIDRLCGNSHGPNEALACLRKAKITDANCRSALVTTEDRPAEKQNGQRDAHAAEKAAAPASPQ